MAYDQSAVLDEPATDDPVVQFVSEKIRAFMKSSSAPGVAVALYHKGRGYLLPYGTIQAHDGDGATPSSSAAAIRRTDQGMTICCKRTSPARSRCRWASPRRTRRRSG